MRLHGGAAEGAAGVGMEPHVDAVDVEAMGTPRKNAHLLALLEVAKAYRAVLCFLLAAGGDAQGEGLDDGGIESAGGGRGGKSSTGTVVGQDEASPDAAVTLAEEEEARAKVEVEGEEEEDGPEEDDGGDEHDLAAEGVSTGARDLVTDDVGIHCASASSLSRIYLHLATKIEYSLTGGREDARSSVVRPSLPHRLHQHVVPFPLQLPPLPLHRGGASRDATSAIASEAGSAIVIRSVPRELERGGYGVAGIRLAGDQDRRAREGIGGGRARVRVEVAGEPDDFAGEAS
ncbi:hypothetical protein ZIOFF_007803 [Zingiber officinale]|uniref:Uncharacterized protein n=1 Tax=Zingiber officinale TaxID=94328 RepID=A0A8J5IEE5_ZINOF|nr:hypothetical protein ZIOFF_007803 [Zingiber officinale]